MKNILHKNKNRSDRSDVFHLSRKKSHSYFVKWTFYGNKTVIRSLSACMKNEFCDFKTKFEVEKYYHIIDKHDFNSSGTGSIFWRNAWINMSTLKLNAIKSIYFSL